MKKIFVISLFIPMIGCSTMSKRQKAITTIVAVASAAAVIGAATAPKDEFPSRHALLWGGVGGSAAALGSWWLYDDAKETAKLKQEAQQLKAMNETLQAQTNPKIVAEGNTLLSAPVPSDVRALFNPGKWKRYKLDRWVQDPENENVWFRQVEMFEIIPGGSK